MRSVGYFFVAYGGFWLITFLCVAYLIVRLRQLGREMDRLSSFLGKKEQREGKEGSA
jgi:hypothetical protein